MGFVNFKKITEKYTDGLMKDNVEKLVKFDSYQCLLSGDADTALKVQNILGAVPADFTDWLKLCDGGLLFDTVMLSTKGYDAVLDLSFDTYEELNSDETKANFALPEGFVIFAVRNYGDPLCFNIKENDGKVYLWNIETGKFDDIWSSFKDWMAEEIDVAINLIIEGVSEPLNIKLL
jgi:hypothetical protein